MNGKSAERRQIQVPRMRRRTRSRRTMRMRTLRPNVLQRSHGPNDTEEKCKKENKKQKVTEQRNVSLSKFPTFSTNPRIATIQEVVVNVHAGRTTTSEAKSSVLLLGLSGN
jgi:hypothetical protein